jgi:uncharacterized surface protein with fasciclin (FAS1) repeats
MDNIVDTAIKAGSFTTLVEAVKAAGLAETLSSPGPFTVFAPTDAAFAKLPEGTLDELLKPESKGRLASILTYQVTRLSSTATVNGKSVPIVAEPAGVFVGGARVVQADVAASNGFIHVIDSVMLPA